MGESGPKVIGGEQFELAVLSDIGTNRENNEDSCGSHLENENCLIFAVADGIGGYEGGEVASAQAVEVTLNAFCENPPSWGPAKRLHRAVQRANIEIHNRAMTVPELRRMGTTLTAAVVSDGVLHAAHIGDCRLYHIRRGKIRQITKDHTVIQERVRMGLMSAAKARNHPERSALSRSLGHELIVSVDRITLPLAQHDRLVVCSDGLYTVVDEELLERTIRGLDAQTACRRLIDLANQLGTADNLTAAVFTMKAETPAVAERNGWRERIFRLFRRGA
ncbi:MAG TPA: protein phosphatase 2C domain-containing protein [Candidatus Binataceae bacterium]|nr:protein phosphatase 2C domain-containing protein [Candidatus Binataceae bacterium]